MVAGGSGGPAWDKQCPLLSAAVEPCPLLSAAVEPPSSHDGRTTRNYLWLTSDEQGGVIFRER